MNRMITRIAVVAALGMAVGCSGGKSNLVAEDGLPVWVDQPCAGIEGDALCAAAESDFASYDVEAAKTDAETAAKNRIADQIEAKVGRLTERLNSAMKDLSSGQVVGERTLKDINQNFQQTTIRGLRYSDYFFWPSRTEPKKVFVRAIVTVDSNKMAQEIIDAMMRGAIAEKLEFKHEEAQNRFDAVRKQYLAEEEAQRAPKPAP